VTAESRNTIRKVTSPNDKNTRRPIILNSSGMIDPVAGTLVSPLNQKGKGRQAACSMAPSRM
jgi:hypothetical protein